MKRHVEIDYSPITQEELVDKVIGYVRDEINIENPLALYVRGSRLRRWNDRNSDFDLVLVVKESNSAALLGQFISTTKKHDFGNFKIDILIKGWPAIYKMILKGDINIVEMFAEKPIWITDRIDNTHAIDLIHKLHKDRCQQALMYISLNRKLGAAGGFLQRTIDRYHKGKMKGIRKSLSTITLWLNYVEQIVLYQRYPDPVSWFSCPKAFELREKMEQGAFTRKEIGNVLDELERSYLRLSAQFESNKKQLHTMSRNSKFYLSKRFLKGMI